MSFADLERRVENQEEIHRPGGACERTRGEMWKVINSVSPRIPGWARYVLSIFTTIALGLAGWILLLNYEKVSAVECRTGVIEQRVSVQEQASKDTHENLMYIRGQLDKLVHTQHNNGG